MKVLNIALIIIIFASFSGCAEEFPFDTELITEDRAYADLQSDNKEPTADYIELADAGFEALVFYDSIMGVDGIVSLANGNLLVVQEYGDPGKAVFLIEKGNTFDINDVFSTIGYPFINPDDIIKYSDGTVYVADGQAQTVFKISKNGGAPVPLTTPSNTRSSFNPFGLAIAPANYDGPNVDPGDIIIADNAYGSIEKAVWAVNPISGVAKIIAEGNVFTDGPILLDFAQDGTLFVNQNTGSGPGRIVTLSANGTVTLFFGPIYTNPSLAVNPKTNEVFFKGAEGAIYRIPLQAAQPNFLRQILANFRI